MTAQQLSSQGMTRTISIFFRRDIHLLHGTVPLTPVTQLGSGTSSLRGTKVTFRREGAGAGLPAPARQIIHQFPDLQSGVPEGGDRRSRPPAGGDGRPARAAF